MVAFSLSLLRKIVFTTCSVFAVIVLGVAADLKTHIFYSFYWDSVQSLAIATAVLTILTLPVMLLVDLRWPQAYTSMVVVELSWVFVLWVLWVATAGHASDISNLLSYGCTISGASGCSETQAIEAFSFINWIFIFGYNITVLSFAVRSALNGQMVWFVSVSDVTWVTSSERAGDVSSSYLGPVTSSYPAGVPPASQGYPLHSLPDQSHLGRQHDSPV